MPLTITMPALSPTMKDGVIAKWLKKEGDQISAGDPLFSVNTDKATLEYESLEDGYLRKIVVGEGQKALVNQAVCVITETADEDISSYQLEEPNLVKEAPKQESSPDQKEPEKAETPTQEPSGGSLNLQTFAPAPPYTGYRHAVKRTLASPLAKKVAKDKGLDLQSIQGSGPHGRVLAKDLEFAQKESTFSFLESEPEETPGTSHPEELSQMRKVIGERLQASKIGIPHYYVTDEIRADRMIDLREQFKQANRKVTFNDFVIRACAMALKKHPAINSGYNSENNTIIRYETVDISLAVSIPDGLITPIIFHANYKDIFTLSLEAKTLAKKAKDRKLKPEEFQGGSFTISNLGMFGIKAFDAVINPPQGAILAVGGIQEKALSVNGKIQSGHTMCVTLSADHRIIDGADSAQFLKTVKQLLENPSLLLV